ncbi:cytochrome c oxidase assembly protein [Natronospirillum operosum]|uniref:Cytochrome c oxidase assembly protein CtaG n=1 Tax=Natronospirillum operosum TaxID=2759953 RepID=A0A4Z0WBI8_9GAMM|nr:cytochrome c oxidase assembly protein [Natronospirillum operosum]TGG91516.1 cytochrome c oxidase assembly protein [Natronospirillum operosum]
MTTDAAKKKSNTKIMVQLGLLAASMIAFVFVGLVPMYNWICEVTGIGGRTTGPTTELITEIDESRDIRVQFMASAERDMPFEFRALDTRVQVHPGQQHTIHYRVTNTSDETRAVQAVPSLSPYRVTEHFHKIECFCFEETVLAPGESLDMPMIFYVDPRLPEDVSSIAMSYSLFNLPGYAQADIKEPN